MSLNTWPEHSTIKLRYWNRVRLEPFMKKNFPCLLWCHRIWIQLVTQFSCAWPHLWPWCFDSVWRIISTLPTYNFSQCFRLFQMLDILLMSRGYQINWLLQPINWKTSSRKSEAKISSLLFYLRSYYSLFSICWVCNPWQDIDNLLGGHPLNSVS